MQCQILSLFNNSFGVPSRVDHDVTYDVHQVANNRPPAVVVVRTEVVATAVVSNVLRLCPRMVEQGSHPQMGPQVPPGLGDEVQSFLVGSGEKKNDRRAQIVGRG